MQTVTVEDFVEWRTVSRGFLQAEVPPADVRFQEDDGQGSLFDDDQAPPAAVANDRPAQPVPRQFLQLAETVSFHRDPHRWNLLYQILWRITHGTPQLLQITTDDDVHRLTVMEKAVRRDSHKMKAFVRFRKVVQNDVEHFIAWHRPDHRIVKRVAPFFARRFKAMHWTILTPAESVVWNQSELHYGPGVARSEAPQADELEQLWLTYYGSIFNPARIKTDMMKSEMPVRHWSTLPETKIIDDLLQEAPQRVQKMVAQSEGFQQTAADRIATLPADSRSLPQLQQLAADCQACDLFRDATQTVFGEGPARARVVIVGEQPGDQEDRAGRPFVGPAGQVLDEALLQAGIDRSEIYLTNVVKHFKHTLPAESSGSAQSGKRRLHAKPNAREVRCCRPWLDAELQQLPDAQVVVCLGATAARTICGPGFSVTRQRGQVLSTDASSQTIATWHPAAILRMPDRIRRAERRQQLADDLRQVHDLLVVR